VATARSWLRSNGFSDTWLQVDGGVSEDTIAIASEAGADTFVAGSAVYKTPNPADMVLKLRNLAKDAHPS
jgi:ribulose-phosphate 3-epimerase